MRSEPDADGGEHGMASVSFVMAAALALTVFSSLANLIVIQYAAGVVRAAVDEGVRDGAVAENPPMMCETSVRAFLDTALGGPYGEDISVSCWQEGSRLVSHVSARFDGYAPLVPDLDFDFEAAYGIEGLLP